MTAINHSHSTNRWSREQIRAARVGPLVALLRERGLQLIELPAGNFEMAAYEGLLIKDSYWRWRQRELVGNTIDLFAKVLGLSFNDAMRLITRTKDNKQPRTSSPYERSMIQGPPYPGLYDGNLAGPLPTGKLWPSTTPVWHTRARSSRSEHLAAHVVTLR